MCIHEALNSRPTIIPQDQWRNAVQFYISQYFNVMLVYTLIFVFLYIYKNMARNRISLSYFRLPRNHNGQKPSLMMHVLQLLYVTCSLFCFDFFWGAFSLQIWRLLLLISLPLLYMAVHYLAWICSSRK